MKKEWADKWVAALRCVQGNMSKETREKLLRCRKPIDIDALLCDIVERHITYFGDLSLSNLYIQGDN